MAKASGGAGRATSIPADYRAFFAPGARVLSAPRTARVGIRELKQAEAAYMAVKKRYDERVSWSALRPKDKSELKREQKKFSEVVAKYSRQSYGE